MEKRFTDIIERLEPDEVERLTNGIDEQLDEVTIARIKKRAISSAFGQQERKTTKGLSRRPKRAIAAIAACAALLTGLGIGSYAIAEDAKEYNAAIAFFDEYDLPTEGLTRTEVKKIYRDITTESFTYSKTAEVIANSSHTDTVEGIGFNAENASPEELKTAWDRFIESMSSYARYEAWYKEDYSETDSTYSTHFDYGYVEKYVGQKLVWRFTTDKMKPHRAFDVSDGVLVLGELPNDYVIRFADPDGGAPRGGAPAVMKLTWDGAFVWLCPLDKGYASCAVQDADGGVTAVTHYIDYTVRSNSRLIVSRITKDGELVSSVENPVEPLMARSITPFGDGYLCIVWDVNDSGPEDKRIVCIDSEGYVTGDLKYSDNGKAYDLVDVKIYGDRLYISANLGDRSFMLPLFENGRMEVTSEEFTEMVKEAYSAVLLVCEPDGGDPQVFYEAKGSGACELATDEQGRLVWEVHSVFTANFTPMLSSRTVDGMAKVCKYCFAEDGSFIKKIDTGEVAVFWR